MSGSSVLTEIFFELLCKKKTLDVKHRRQIISFDVLYKSKSKPKKQYVVT